MRIINDVKLDFKDVLISPKRSTLRSRSEVNLNRSFKTKNSSRVLDGVPIVAANMDRVATFEMCSALAKHQVYTALHKHYSVDQLITFLDSGGYIDQQYMFYSMGILENDQLKYQEVLKAIQTLNQKNADTQEKSFEREIKNVCIDVANGYSQRFVSFVKWFREHNPETILMAGNVVTPEMTEELILAGVDIVKVGIGPGSVCTTRKMTGVGYPQLSAVIECADAAHGLGGLICSDGGCVVPGDIAKAFGGGADFVMLGGMLAGHTECGGEVVLADSTGAIQGTYKIDELPSSTLNQNGSQLYMDFHGMSSQAAMNQHSGGVADYRASEGKEVLVPFRGPVHNTIKEILGGLRSTCTYVGASSLKELSKRTTFVRVTQTHNTTFGN